MPTTDKPVEHELTMREAEEHNNLGVVYYTQGKLEEAVTEYQQALGINPNYADAHNSLGAAHSAQGKLAEAIAEYTEAIRINHNHADAHSVLGAAYAGQGSLPHSKLTITQ
jgi:tetratricopeptide (TPR) repeat protein